MKRTIWTLNYAIRLESNFIIFSRLHRSRGKARYFGKPWLNFCIFRRSPYTYTCVWTSPTSDILCSLRTQVGNHYNVVMDIASQGHNSCNIKQNKKSIFMCLCFNSLHQTINKTIICEISVVSLDVEPLQIGCSIFAIL